MALTRATVEANLVRRIGHLLTVAGLDGATVSGSNADLADPIAFALRELGIAVATLNNPTDAEVGTVATDDHNQLLGVAEIRAMQTALNCVLDLVNTEAGNRVDEYGQLANGLQKRLDDAEDRARRLYGWAAGVIEAGYATLDFAQHADDD
jgi:hypothetical protein